MPLPIKCVMCFGLTCLILGFLFLATFSSHLMPAVIYTAKFKKVACTVTSSDYYPEDSCCDLSTPTEEKPCKIIYPCLRVIVAVIEDGDTVADNATLYDSYTTIYYQPKEGSCSMYTCGTTYDESKKITDAFRAQYGAVGSSIDCYYKHGEPETALRWRRSNSFFIEMTILSLALIAAGSAITSYAYWKQARSDAGDDLKVKLVDDVNKALSGHAETPSKSPPTDPSVEAPTSHDDDEKSPKSPKSPKSGRRHKAEQGASGSGHSEHHRKSGRVHSDLEALPEGGSQVLHPPAPTSEHGSDDGRKHKRKGKKTKKARDHEPESLTPETTTSEIV